MWDSSGVLSSPAMKRRSEPSGFVSPKYPKFPRLSRTSTGTSAGAPVMSAPVGVRSKVISLRNDHLSFHHAFAGSAKPSAPMSRNKSGALERKKRIGRHPLNCNSEGRVTPERAHYLEKV